MPNILDLMGKDSNNMKQITKETEDAMDKIQDEIKASMQQDITQFKKEEEVKPVIQNEPDNQKTEIDLSSIKQEISDEVINALKTQNDLILQELQSLKANEPKETVVDLSQIEATLKNNTVLLNNYISKNCEFQDRVQRDMFKEKQDLQKIVNREYMIPALSTIAATYGQWYHLSEDAIDFSDPKACQNYQRDVGYLLDELADFLEEEGCEIYRSKAGDPLRARYSKSKPQNFIKTGDQSLHRIVAESLNPGISKDNRVLYVENCKSYVYDEALAKQEEIKEEEIKTEEVQEEVVNEPVLDESNQNVQE